MAMVSYDQSEAEVYSETLKARGWFLSLTHPSINSVIAIASKVVYIFINWFRYCEFIVGLNLPYCLR